MSMIAVLAACSLVTVIAVIGLADALTHILCRAARALREPAAMRVASPSARAARRGGPVL